MSDKMGTVIWFTGLSGSGKTTIALKLKELLESKNKRIEILDGDTVRNTLHKHLDFSREDIRENNRLIAELANKKISDFDFILIPIISPYAEDRKMARSIVGKEFLELFINAPLSECIKRDVKGMYKKAIAGEIDNFIGVSKSNPYQPPKTPDIEINTSSLGIIQSTESILNFLKNNGLL